MMIRLKSASVAFAAALLVAGPVMAADAPPAVSAPNVKADLTGGALGGGPAALGSVTATVPLGHSFGFQADAALGTADADYRGGVAGHIFYRDPRDMLLGVTAMWSRLTGPYDDSDSNIRRFGAEAEFYLGDYSVLPSLGVQNDHGDATGYATLAGIYYPNPYLALGASVTGFANSRGLQTGVEYQFDPQMPLSLLADVGVSNDGPAFVLAGVRYSFGATFKSVKERDRFDDPGNIVRYMNTVGASAITGKTDHVTVTPVVTGGGGGPT